MPEEQPGSRPESGSELHKSKTVEQYEQDFERIMDRELPVCLGFSARLNMLWDLAGAAPPQTEGRVISVLGINRDWREADVRKWLQKDVLPPRLEQNPNSGKMCNPFSRSIAPSATACCSHRENSASPRKRM